MDFMRSTSSKSTYNSRNVIHIFVLQGGSNMTGTDFF